MDSRERLARELFWRLLGYSDRADPWAVFAHWELTEPLRLDCLLMAENAMASDWLRDTLAAERRAGFIAGRDAGAKKATSFLVGDPKNGVPLRSPGPHEIAAAIRNLEPEATDEI